MIAGTLFFLGKEFAPAWIRLVCKTPKGNFRSIFSVKQKFDTYPGMCVVYVGPTRRSHAGMLYCACLTQHGLCWVPFKSLMESDSVEG